MSQQEPASGSGAPPAAGPAIAGLTAVSPQEVAEARAAIARELNGPLTALLLYMGEIKQHSRQLSKAKGDRTYLQQVVENALQQTERIWAILKQVEGFEGGPTAAPGHQEPLVGAARGEVTVAGVMFSSDAGQKPLTKRECEALNLISEGNSNKQGALRMRISPRTFESHRAEAMRKLGVRNTAELVRAALKHPDAV
jgi:DNA-binding CsgD family transcriptional regulator